MRLASPPKRPEEVHADRQASSFHHSGMDIAGLPVRLATTSA
jgi:hypothetical protein